MGKRLGPPRWALILGVSSGFGAATARALADDGHHIFGVHLDRRATLPQVATLREELLARSVDALFWNANAADEQVRHSIIDEIAARLRAEGATLAVYVHSLAFGSLAPYVAVAPEKGMQARQMEMTLDVMAHSFVYWAQAIVERGLIDSGGRMFAMTSSGARLATPAYGAVSAAKAALEAHVRQLAYELLPRGITVNAILAGVSDTPALRKIPGHEVLIGKSVAKSPVSRLTKPEDVGPAIAALCDPRLHWMTGNVLGVHGGEEIIG